MNSVFSWDSGVLLSDDSISEINFWNNVDPLNVEFIRGYNRYRSELVSPMLPIQPVARLSSPTLDWFVCLFVCREPKAVYLTLEAFAGRLSNARVIWYSDNKNVESALLSGSRKLDLQVLASKHYKFALSIAFFFMLGGSLGIFMS